ncbi:hypothetical protein M3Y97_00662000 [Aphelenchoides bicaudatus]|nr:hypothetical protein M3Y97_00662000 [Aphelenchoides bicaudatus]
MFHNRRNSNSVESTKFLRSSRTFMGVDGNMTDKLFTVQSWIGLTQILLIPIDFVYRYLSVCRNHELSTRSIGIMVFMSYLIVWFYMFPVKWWCQSTMAGPAPGMENYTAMLEGVPEWSGHDFSYSISAKDGTKPEWISSVYVIGMNAFTLLVIFYTSIRIHWTIGHKTSMSNNKKAMKIHRQVTKILVVQAALPLIVFIGPICAIIFCGFNAFASSANWILL